MKEKEEKYSSSYRKLLAMALGIDGTRILRFKNKPVEKDSGFGFPLQMQQQPQKMKRFIPHIWYRKLDAPDLVDDFYLNLMDWGRNNFLSIALSDTVYLWNASNRATSELVTVDQESGPVTSVSWSPDGRHIAIGLNSSVVQLWGSSSKRLLRTLRGAHESGVGSLSWNNTNILTTGGEDGKIVNHDVRMRSLVVQRYEGHQGEVCGLKWSSSGEQLASGGNDRLVYIWNRSMSSSRPQNQTQWLHRFEDHTSAVKALAWCPFQSDLLASGGGENDRCIKFWNTKTGSRIKSVNTGAQVTSLLWSKSDKELLSSHGHPQNQLTLWKYPSMGKISELTETAPILYTTQSPDGCTVASAGDESIRLWKLFGEQDVRETARSAKGGPFADCSRGMIR